MQTHSGSGDNIFRDKNISIQYGERKIPKYLTEIPLIEDEIIGREDVVADLFARLDKGQRVLLVNGMGGIGKTTTAISFVNTYFQEYTHIAWVEQLTDFATDLATNKILTRNLGFTPTDDPISDGQLILNDLANLRGQGKSLLVIDNADQQLNAFKKLLPRAPDWHVLITSREEMSFAEMVRLDFLSEEAALQLFYSHYDLDRDDEMVKTILISVDYHTLTVELLAKTAQKRAIAPVSKLARILEEKGLRIGRRLEFEVTHSGDEKVAKLFPYLKAIFQLDQNTTAKEIELLKQFVGLPSRFFQTTELFSWLGIDAEDDEVVDDLTIGLDLLREKGWLIVDDEKRAYKMHRVIQEVLWEHLEVIYTDLEDFVERIGNLLYVDQDYDNPVDKFPLVPFGEKILSRFPGEKVASFAKFQANLASVYRELGRYKDAVSLLEPALDLLTSYYDKTDLVVKGAQASLALVYQDLGRYKESADLLEQMLNLDLKHYGESHSFVAVSRSNLATVYQDLGRYEESASLLEQALASDLSRYEESHPVVAIRRSNLALVYRDLGRYEESANLLEKALTLSHYEESHPNVTIIRSNLAVVYRDLGRYDESASLTKQALASDLMQFGDSHPYVAIGQWNLALVYAIMDRYPEAIDLAKKAYNICKKIYGTGHPNTQKVRQFLAEHS